MKKAVSLFSLLGVLGLPLVLGMALSSEAFSYDGSRPDPVGTPTKVRLEVFVIDVDEINSSDQNFTANVAIKATWKDAGLAREGTPARLKPLDEVWNPGLQILNQQLIWGTMPKKVKIKSDGTVTYTQRFFGKFSNPLNLRSFPFDHQKLSVRVVATLLTHDEIKFVDSDKKSLSGISEKLSVPDWKVVHWSAKPKAWELVRGGLSRPGFEFQFVAQRHVSYFILKVFIPLIMIVMMSWVVFWLEPSQAGTQISVAVTSMLTLIAYRFLLGTLLPPVSYMTRMDYFILGSTALVFAAFIESVITVRLAAGNRATIANRIDWYCRWIFPIWFVALVVGVRFV